MGEEGVQEQFWEMTTYWTQPEETESQKGKCWPASLAGSWIGVWVCLTRHLCWSHRRVIPLRKPFCKVPVHMFYHKTTAWHLTLSAIPGASVSFVHL